MDFVFTINSSSSSLCMNECKHACLYVSVQLLQNTFVVLYIRMQQFKSFLVMHNHARSRTSHINFCWSKWILVNFCMHCIFQKLISTINYSHSLNECRNKRKLHKYKNYFIEICKVHKCVPKADIVNLIWQ